MMQEYVDRKAENKDCILLYRVGDFFEMFFDDALTVSKELELTLTSKECGLPERAPMCGVPFHAVDNYITRLIKLGHKVAVCDQVEDPKFAKGLVKREITRIVTPGTMMGEGALDESRNNYIACICADDDAFGFTFCDASTGEFSCTQCQSLSELTDEIGRIEPSEIICNEPFTISGIDLEDIKEKYHLMVTVRGTEEFAEERCRQVLTDQFKVHSLDGLGLSDMPSAAASSGALLSYLFEIQRTKLDHILEIRTYHTGEFMHLGGATIRNLELLETMRAKEKRGTLLWVLDHTKTAMGARLIRSWIEKPLVKKNAIDERLDCVGEMLANEISTAELREYLNPVYDLERLCGRISYGSANPRDLLALLNSLKMLPHIHGIIHGFESPLLKSIDKRFDECADLAELLEGSLDPDPPLTVKEGGIIKDGYNKEVDELRAARTSGKNWLAEMEMNERSATGIPTLKIKFNRVFGYCIEVTNTYKNNVPDRYIRKQTLSTGERFTTPELKELEDKILGAQDRLNNLEYDLFCEIRDKISSAMSRVLEAAHHVACVDALASFAYTASRNHYVRPVITNDSLLDIREGRHPVVEKMQKDNTFVPNDTVIDGKTNRVSVITGPNMAGKSTYMRQTALIVLMAQIGSYVPASKATIGVVDQIFTRVGASDDLASGQSTFMVEMTEVASILKAATSKSLLILDEIGRGTSTFDGLSLAWAIVEHVADKKKLGAKTLFATHYHELTELEGKLDGVRNYCIAVKESSDGIVFLRKIVQGGADKSYGIQVARLAGLPESVLKRAEVLSGELSNADITAAVELLTGYADDKEESDEKKETGDGGKASRAKKKKTHYDEVDLTQMSFFDTANDSTILDELKELDISNLTPLEALNTLYRFQTKLKNRYTRD